MDETDLGRNKRGCVNDIIRNDLLIIYVDADACPVKDEIYRVAARHRLLTRVVTNSWLRLPNLPLIELSIVSESLDAADDWIVKNIVAYDIAVTADIRLAARCLEKSAVVLSPNGKPFDDRNIGSALATHDLMANLRERGEVSGRNPSFTNGDRIRFMDSIEKAIQTATRTFR